MFELMKLPYELDALEPFMSKETLEYHYEKHHATYVKNLNMLVKGTIFENTKDLITIIKNTKGPIFNNAAQVYNHDFFWKCLSPNKSDPIVEGTPNDELLTHIEKQWSTFEKFKEDFITQAKTHFGSGWCYFYLDKNKDELLINTFHDAKNPITHDIKMVPLLVIDLWEHSWYIQYRNEKEKYLNQTWNLVNWEFVNENYFKTRS